MAAIYLTHCKDKQHYIACFKELSEKLPGSPTAVLLGDAYMHIQEVYTCRYRVWTSCPCNYKNCDL